MSPTGTFSQDNPAFELGVTLAQESEGQILASNDPYIKLSVGFRSYLAELSGNELKTLLVIGLRINDNYESWPSLRTIGKECGFSKTTAGRCVDRLEALDLVEVAKGKKKVGGHTENTGNRYKLKVHFGIYGSDPLPQARIDQTAPGVPPADHLPPGVPFESPQVSRLSGTEVDPLKEDNNNDDSFKNQEILREAGVWTAVAPKYAAQFTTAEIEAALDLVPAAKFDGKRGAVIKSTLDRWLEYPEDRAREVARSTKDPYKQPGYWDD